MATSTFLYFSLNKILNDLTQMLNNAQNANDYTTLGQLYALYLGSINPSDSYAFGGTEVVDNDANTQIFVFTETTS